MLTGWLDWTAAAFADGMVVSSSSLSPRFYDALTGMSLYLLCGAVLAVCGHLLWRELAVRAGWRRPRALVSVMVLTFLAVVVSLGFVPVTEPVAWPTNSAWLEQRRQALQALGDEVIGQVTDPDGLLPAIPAQLSADSGASWRVPARQPHRYVYRPPLVPIPLAEIEDWIILHEPPMDGALQLAFTGSGDVLELGGYELLDRLGEQQERVVIELQRIDPNRNRSLYP